MMKDAENWKDGDCAVDVVAFLLAEIRRLKEAKYEQINMHTVTAYDCAMSATARRCAEIVDEAPLIAGTLIRKEFGVPYE